MNKDDEAALIAFLERTMAFGESKPVIAPLGYLNSPLKRDQTFCRWLWNKPDPSGNDDGLLRHLAHGASCRCSERDRAIYESYAWGEQSYARVGREFGLSRSRIEQIIRRCVRCKYWGWRTNVNERDSVRYLYEICKRLSAGVPDHGSQS